jgi:glycosyltransferase involved in cell wall biosynthesis
MQIENNIKISYLVSTYDSGHYLDRHIADLLQNQTDPRFEIIIVNPNSPGTDNLIGTKWAELDHRVQYLYWPKREWYGESWLRAWKNAKGEFVINSNTDDFHAPETTAAFYQYMKLATSDLNAGKKIGFGYSGLQVIDEFGRILGGGLKPAFDFEVMSRECWAGPQVCWRNDATFKRSLDWNLMAQRAAEYKSAYDYWQHLYFMSLGYHAYVIQQILTIYTQRPNSIENSNKWANNYETYSAISEFFPHNFDKHLKHAKEFQDFTNLPPREEWIQTMQEGKKWPR